MDITEVIAQAKSQTERPMVGYVFDAPIHYVVLKRDDNKLTIPFMTEYMRVLDEIEATTGPGVVVTIGVGDRHFSTGFDMQKWVDEPSTYLPSNEMLGTLMDRLIRLSLPSMCCFNGNAMAGGYFMGICHDFRTMTTKHGRVCLNELLFGGSLTETLMASLTAKLNPSTITKMHSATMILPQEALAEGIIDNTYADNAALMGQIKAFAKRYAQVGQYRDIIRLNKEN